MQSTQTLSQTIRILTKMVLVSHEPSLLRSINPGLHMQIELALNVLVTLHYVHEVAFMHVKHSGKQSISIEMK
jgi:hypothetical protein